MDIVSIHSVCKMWGWGLMKGEVVQGKISNSYEGASSEETGFFIFFLKRWE